MAEQQVEAQQYEANLCMPTPFMPEHVELANAYVPYQQDIKSYTPQESLDRGTMFPDLYRPYVKRGGIFDGTR